MGYIIKSVNERGQKKVEDVRLAYLILAHKCPEQVSAFINQLLDYGECDVYVHVDKKNLELFTSLKEKYESIEWPNDRQVYICSIYDVRWGSFEIIKAALELMRMVWSSGRRYTHMYFGSGQDLIVKNGLYEYLSENLDNIFIRINRTVSNRSRISATYKVQWPKKLMIRNDWHPYRFIRIAIQILCMFNIVYRKNTIKLSKKTVIYEGRTWFIAPISLIEYILDYINNNPEYMDFWENSLASDLMFFQTIIMNSKYKQYVKDELMYVNFGHHFGTCNHPLDITIEDDEVINAGNYFCARKFNINNIGVMTYYLNKTKREI